MPINFDDLLAKKRPTTIECQIALDADVAEAHALALTAYEMAKMTAADNPGQKSAKDALRAAETALRAAEDEAVEAVVAFKFQGISRADWESLIDEHQATRDQKEKARLVDQAAPWNDDTFPPALVAACCVDPEMTYEQAQSMWKSDRWNFAELDALFNAAYNASRGRRVPQLGKGSGRTLN